MAKPPKQEPDDSMRLNKFLAHSGVASRRAAADIIKAGRVFVDGERVVDIGFRVKPKQKVTVDGKPVKPVSKKVYLLLNKPKDYITTVKDEKGRKTVIDLVKHKVKERVYPVGRLDRQTTGLLLLTNDGDLAKKLSHPSYEVVKRYHAVLDRPVTKQDLNRLLKGVKLEDGVTKVDAAVHAIERPKTEVGLELHSGKNRIIRRLFAELGYKVKRLDRVYFAGLTKKDLPRGRFRQLTKEEIVMLKHFT